MRKIFEIFILLSILISILITLKYAFGDSRELAQFDDPNDPNGPVNTIIQYCIQHADRAAAGENVTQDLVKIGIIPSEFGNLTCAGAQQQHNYESGLQVVMNAYCRFHPEKC